MKCSLLIAPASLLSDANQASDFLKSAGNKPISLLLHKDSVDIYGFQTVKATIQGNKITLIEKKLDGVVYNDGKLVVDKSTIFNGKIKVCVPYTEHNFGMCAHLVAQGAEVFGDDWKTELEEKAETLKQPSIDEKAVLIDSLKDERETLSLALKNARDARNKLVPEEILSKIRDRAKVEVEDRMSEYISTLKKNGKVPRDSEGYRDNVIPEIEKRIDELLNG
jgi:hypothetical protein